MPARLAGAGIIEARASKRRNRIIGNLWGKSARPCFKTVHTGCGFSVM